uniref:restriction endonuclease subunit S n=1 Tax=Eubacterium cellulosolvens TaxID=29322 RepID=UPI00048A088E|nr:restriction endonuclease subunit S [[Eubacterium] cellulosolvens]
MRKMRDSGIEWVGQIPENWELGQIGQLYDERKVKVSDRDYPPLSVTMEGVVPQLSTAAKTDAHDDRKLVKKGDFAINSRSDRRGSCGISDYDGSVSLINTILCPQTEMNPQYYDWLFHTTMFSDEFYKWGHGIVDDLWTTNWSDMKKISVPVPTIEEQQSIATYLNHLCSLMDSVIKKTKASIEEYKKLRQAIITHAVTVGVRGDRTMKDSGIEWIGNIPEEWEVFRIAALYSERKENGNDELPILTVSINTGVSDRELSNDESERVFVRSEDRSKYMRVYPGDLTYNMMRAWQGAFGAVRVDGMVSPAYVIVKPRREIDSRYMEALLRTQPAKEEMKRYSHGIADFRLRLYWDKFRTIKVCFPPIEEQREIADYIDSKCAEIDELIAKKEQFLAELENYKKSMIYEYVTGKKEVPHS